VSRFGNGPILKISKEKGKNNNMRSDLIYDALGTVQNRYLLCQLASKATRKFHKPNTRVQETMNEVLTRVGQANKPERIMGSTEEVFEPQRRAA
jgi:hypothetical protein